MEQEIDIVPEVHGPPRAAAATAATTTATAPTATAATATATAATATGTGGRRRGVGLFPPFGAHFRSFLSPPRLSDLLLPMVKREEKVKPNFFFQRPLMPKTIGYGVRVVGERRILPFVACFRSPASVRLLPFACFRSLLASVCLLPCLR